REGFLILHSPRGGVEDESSPESIRQYKAVEEVPLPNDFMKHLTSVMDRENLSFVEINPLVVRGDECILLDAAVLADSAGGWQASWGEADIVEAGAKSQAENVIAELNDGSPASFSFRIL